MKTHPSDPPRIDEHGPEALRDLVRGMRRSGPSDAAMGRMSKRLAMGGALAEAPSEQTPVSHAERNFAFHKIGFVALAVVGGFALSWHATQALVASGAPRSAVAAREVSNDRGPTEPAPSTDPSGVRSVDDNGVGPATISVDDLPSAAPRTAAPPATALTGSAIRANARPSEASAGSRESATELDLVQQAQAALGSDPQRALALTDEHARAYPSGELVQEREVLAVEALSRLGRKDEALRRARALVQRFPRTPYAARLELALGRPIDATSAEPTDRRHPAAPAR